MKPTIFIVIIMSLLFSCEGESGAGSDRDGTRDIEDSNDSNESDGSEKSGGSEGSDDSREPEDSNESENSDKPDNSEGTGTPIDGPFDGEGTYYAATGDGACMLGESPNDMDVAALNSEQWSTSAWCGACAEVTGPKGSVTLRIVDLCPECVSGDLDMSQQAFGKVAEMAAGRVDISWDFVPCNVKGNVSYRYKDGANQWWTAVQVRNHRLPISKLEWSPDGSTWNATVREDYNYFLDENGFGPNPVRVRVTAVDGQTIEDELPVVQEELEIEGNSQFN